MIKGLEALKEIIILKHWYCVAKFKNEVQQEIDTEKAYGEKIKIIEKELKALEIIRNIGILKPYETIGGKCWLETMCDATKITKENYDLLKEVLL